MARQSIGGNSFGTKWNPSVDGDGNPKDKADKGDFVQGYLIEHEEKTFANNNNPSQIYTIEIAQDPNDGEDYKGFGTEGEKISLFGCAVLDKKMAEVMQSRGLGVWVHVEYKGRELKKACKQILEKNPRKKFESKDYVKLFDVATDTEIPSKEGFSKPAYKPVVNNSAPAPAEALPDSLDDEPELLEEEKPKSKPAPAKKAPAKSSDLVMNQDDAEDMPF
jgi:hypothetical protein